ncbi:hypothetical protein TNCV_751441 [Trichonephila clavipes]|uniref:Uncharacterized protein n=1 Tax=Trichonephila clavipes TaxID=2585209 RepID=A0A8X6WBQ1_TRICX|nr:hypothetical protein TNCV_751441 [Trichonephila clavipes]
MESMRLLITSWGILSHSSRKAFSNSWRVCGGGWRPATRLPRASQTFSIGFMSGEHAGYSIRTIPSSKRESCTRSDDLIPISASSQRSISNDVVVCAPVNGEMPPYTNTPPSQNLTLSCTNAGLFLLSRSLQMKIRLLSGWTEKWDSSEKRTLLHSFLLQFTCSVALSLRSRRCLDVSLTHTSGQLAYRPTMEPVSDSLS